MTGESVEPWEAVPGGEITMILTRDKASPNRRFRRLKNWLIRKLLK